MGHSTSSMVVLLTWVFSVLCLKAHGDGSQVSVKFVKSPSAFSSVASATFKFEVIVGQNVDGCRICAAKCKLDDLSPSKCDFKKEVSYSGLQDGQHTFEVCINASQGAQCASYNWTVDTIPPTAYVSSERSFTNSLNVSVDISFSEPCAGGGGFGCSSVNACNVSSFLFMVLGKLYHLPSRLCSKTFGFHFKWDYLLLCNMDVLCW